MESARGWSDRHKGSDQHGDTQSPYLLILVADVLSRMMERQVASGLIEGIRPKHGCSTIHHLFFADDSFFFSPQRVSRECKNLKNILEQYCATSGQQ